MSSLYRMFQRRGTKQQWETTNPVLSVGEIGFSINENVIKVGDGLTAWNSLPSVNGNSAYEIAQNNGFSGTETQWLDSLQGDSGDSAYDIAVNNGYEGTEAEWLESLANTPHTQNASTIITTSVDKSENYTLTSEDKNSYIRSTGDPITITVPDILSNGDSISFVQAGTGQITFLGSSITINSVDSKLKTASQFSGAVVTKLGGAYYLIGSLGD